MLGVVYYAFVSLRCNEGHLDHALLRLKEYAAVTEAPLDALSREQKLLLLKRLRSKLASLVAALTAKQAGAPITKVTPQTAAVL